jgi:flagellar biosynthesis/type III secretory pathway protein FliH
MNKYEAVPEEDGKSWMVWSFPYHYGTGLTESEAKDRAERLNEEFEREESRFDDELNKIEQDAYENGFQDGLNKAEDVITELAENAHYELRH